MLINEPGKKQDRINQPSITNRMKSETILKIAGALAALALLIPAVVARGMPTAQRDAIHGLFDSHDKFQRDIKQTDEGYISKTTSDDPAAVKLIQTHVKQMESRLKDGLMVRGWDPAYVEFVRHYDDIDIQITNIDKGISIVAIGKTEAAKKVARNHAGIISKFIDQGWKEHDKSHAAVYGKPAATTGESGSSGMACCQQGGQKNAQTGDSCCAEGEEDCQVDSNTGGTSQSCCQKSI